MHFVPEQRTVRPPIHDMSYTVPGIMTLAETGHVYNSRRPGKSRHSQAVPGSPGYSSGSHLTLRLFWALLGTSRTWG